MQNKANFHYYADRGTGVPRGNRAKQSQFPAGQDTPPFHYSITPMFHARANCVKQSQFPGRGLQDRRP
jgi:hypothetical protein